MKLELTQHFSVFLPRDKERVEEKVREKRKKRKYSGREFFFIHTVQRKSEREKEGSGRDEACRLS